MFIAMLKKANFKIVLYLAICATPLVVVAGLSDLPISIGGWANKTNEILNGHIPKSNFYPAGSAIMLIPFIWDSPKYLFVIFFYFLGGAALYWKICENIGNRNLRLISLSALPLNPYLIWLCYSSQDTVFEFFVLMLVIYSSLKNNPYLFVFSGLLLCLIRPSYWIMYLAIGIYLFFKKNNTNKARYVFILPLLLFPINSIYNYLQYNSFSPANESGITAYFSYNKYYYLAHPKYDMDVFLSKEGHMEVKGLEKLNESDSNSLYLKMAVESIKENPKETVLGTLQKVDSYIFDIQKIPHLPGEYYLSKDSKVIIIGDERLEWKFVIGNLIYAAGRIILLLFYFPSLVLYYLNRKRKLLKNIELITTILILPWISGLIPGLLFYTETRFKIISELLLIPFICIIFSNAIFKPETNED